MEKLSYNNSYPDSTDSSPRSREIDFDNPPPWDDHNNHYKVRFMCSYGGKIQPRPHDNQLTYVNGETKILSVDRGIRFPVLASKLSAVCGDVGGGDVLFKYQLPGEDLDALISVTNDDDLEHMMHEYDRLVRVSAKPARMRLFLFPVSSGGFGSEGSSHSDRDRFVEALNTVRNRSEPEKGVTEKIAAPPPHEVKVPVPVVVEPPVHRVEMERQVHEFQRMQIRDQEAGLMETGGYLSPPYSTAQPPPPPQQMSLQTNTQAPPMPYWQGNNSNPGGLYPTTAPGIPEQPVYMVPAPTPTPHPGTVYHAPQGVMRPGQGNQGGYYPQVQRIPSDTYREQNQPAYNNIAQPQVGARAPQQQQPPPPQPFTSGPLPPPQPQYSAAPPLRQVVGLPDTTAYTQVNYAGGMGKQVYYTEAPPPQYHGGVGLPVNGMSEVRTGPDGRPVVMNVSPKVSSQSSDSAM
ncbi:unnamed protein product [Eruca vesicaria subsp. sativa]|uniref:PB1 domain-containing protein n=1 Tax=Eruca vesicaria subsp. sativa TaxID=29727 RepID=A0ABC8KC37_ERUVS|nr:unnamed protein product [Eruca vesicaria subsp. sativa]